MILKTVSEDLRGHEEKRMKVGCPGLLEANWKLTR